MKLSYIKFKLHKTISPDIISAAQIIIFTHYCDAPKLIRPNKYLNINI